MKRSKQKASQTVAMENVAALKEWISKTPKGKIPMNSQGRSSKQAICRILNIPRSTIGTNKDIQAIFNELDCPVADGEKPKIENEISISLPVTIEALSLQISYLLDEMDGLKAALNRLRYLDNSGKHIY